MAVPNSVRHLLDFFFVLTPRQVLAFLDKVIQVTATGVLHNHHDVLLVLKHFKQPNYVWMPDLLQNVNFLEHFLLRILLLQLFQLNHLDGYKFTRQFVYSQIDLSKSAISNFFDELIKVKACLWKFIVHPNVWSNMSYNLISLLHDFFV